MPESSDMLSERETQGRKLAEDFVAACKAVRDEKLRDEWILGVIGDWCESVRLDAGPRPLSAGDYLRVRLRRMQARGIDWYEDEPFREKLLQVMALGWKERLAAEDKDVARGMLIRHHELLQDGIESGTAIHVATPDPATGADHG